MGGNWLSTALHLPPSICLAHIPFTLQPLAAPTLLEVVMHTIYDMSYTGFFLSFFLSFSCISSISWLIHAAPAMAPPASKLLLAPHIRAAPPQAAHATTVAVAQL